MDDASDTPDTPDMFRQLQHDVAVVTAGLEAGGIFVTESAVIDQLKVRNKEYARKPAVGALFAGC